jgi:hypothetical protein
MANILMRANSTTIITFIAIAEKTTSQSRSDRKNGAEMNAEEQQKASKRTNETVSELADMPEIPHLRRLTC